MSFLLIHFVLLVLLLALLFIYCLFSVLSPPIAVLRPRLDVNTRKARSQTA